MIVTLCGSARFERGFQRWNELLTLDGHVVLSLAVLPAFHGGDKDWYTEAQKRTLDEVHKRKVDLADVVVVVTGDSETDNQAPYWGASTESEIRHAQALNRPTYRTDLMDSRAEPMEFSMRVRNYLTTSEG